MRLETNRCSCGNKNCNGCNQYVTSDYIMYTGDSDSCTRIESKSRLTDIIRKIFTSLKSKITKIKSDSLKVIDDSTDCEKGFRVELEPSQQSGNKLILGIDGKPYVSGSSISFSDIENTQLNFKKPITFSNNISTQNITAQGTIVGNSFKINRDGVETIIPVFKGIYSNTITYYKNDSVSYNGELWYYYNDTQSSGIIPTQGNYWTKIVEKGESGINANYPEFIYNKTVSKDVLPTIDSVNPQPNGWSKEIPQLSSGEVLWMSTSIKDGGDNSLIQAWSTPIRMSGTDGMNGSDGSTGESGNFTEFRYAKNSSTTVAPQIIITEFNPSGWSTIPPQKTDTEYIWVSTAMKSGTILVQQWSVPVRWSGINGTLSNEPFSSLVFKRSQTQPNTPTDGSWNNPIPSGWESGYPSGTDPIWMSSRRFTKDGLFPQDAAWSTPVKVVSSGSLQVKYSSVLENPGTPDTVPAWWSDTPNAQTNVWIAMRTVEASGEVSSWKVWKIKGRDGINGVDGVPGQLGPAGPFLAYMGIWNSQKIYYGGADRVNAVLYNGQYYVSRGDAGGAIPIGTLPTNTQYWNGIGTQFESVATNLLLAQIAYIKNLGVSFLRTGNSQPGVAGTEHLEIYPSLQTLRQWRDQGEVGYVNLNGPVEDVDLHLRNLANTMIFYGVSDTGARDKTSVEANQLMKLQAIGQVTIPGITLPDNTTTPSVTLPGGSTIFQKAELNTSNLSASEFKLENGTATPIVRLNGKNNTIAGTTYIERLYVPRLDATNIPADANVWDTDRLVSGRFLSFRPPISGTATTLTIMNTLLITSGHPYAAGIIYIINNASTTLTVNLDSPATGGGFYKKGSTTKVTNFTVSPYQTITLIPATVGEWYEI